MSNLQITLPKIYNWLKLYRPEYCSSLQSGLTQKEIDAQTRELSFKLPQEIYQLYQWKNGSPLDSATSFSKYFFSTYLFLPLERTKIEYYQNIEIFEEDWFKNWFPIFSLEGYSYFVMCQEQSVDHSPILYYDYEQPSLVFCYDNLTAMMSTIAECYETGAYYIDEKGWLQEDELKVAPIYKKHNPLSQTRT